MLQKNLLISLLLVSRRLITWHLFKRHLLCCFFYFIFFSHSLTSLLCFSLPFSFAYHFLRQVFFFFCLSFIPQDQSHGPSDKIIWFSRRFLFYWYGRLFFSFHSVRVLLSGFIHIIICMKTRGANFTP